MQQRRFSRIAFDAQVTMKTQGQSCTGRLVDISLKGVLVHCEKAWSAPRDTAAELDIRLSPDVLIHMDATVAHCSAQRVGFHCRHIDVESISHLRRVLELNTGDPQLLDRELSALGE